MDIKWPHIPVNVKGFCEVKNYIKIGQHFWNYLCPTQFNWKQTEINRFYHSIQSCSVRHLDLAIFVCSSLVKVLRICLDFEGSCEQPGYGHHTDFSIGFKPEAWLGHSKTLIRLWWSQCFVDLDIRFVSLLCWNVNFLFIFSFQKAWWFFPGKTYIWNCS